MKLNISPEHFLELQKRGYSLDFVFLLRMVNDALEVDALCRESVRIDVMRTTLIRKGLLTETGDKLTILGQELLVFMETKIAGKIQRKKIDDDAFSLWWSTFPSTDTFTHRGKKFQGCRTLRQNREECRLKFDKILLEGEYTAEAITKALQYDVENKKEMSYKTGTNKLSYMQNSLTYLNQRSYEGYIELGQQEQTINTTLTGSTDI